MKTDNRHKESTKAMQEFINALRECLGKEPLYDYTYEEKSDHKRERKSNVQVSADSGSRNRAA